MATLREHISSIRSLLKLTSTDNLLTDRFLAAELKASSLLLIKRETDKRKLWATDTVFTTIPCLKLKEVSVSECCAYADDRMIARTELKVPRIAEGNYQYIIQGVYSINVMGGKGVRLKEITINRYLNLLKLPVLKRETYYWINDDYLYVSDSNVQKIRLSALFEEDIPLDMLYPECDCGNKVPDEEWCINPLDREFFLPGYLQEQAYKLVSDKLLSSYYRIPQDNSTDGKDQQSPNMP